MLCGLQMNIYSIIVTVSESKSLHSQPRPWLLRAVEGHTSLFFGPPTMLPCRRTTIINSINSNYVQTEITSDRPTSTPSLILW